ncbi:MAG: CRISPR-associated endonuclease Cas3'' [Alphaproteobacteria bacterium]|nr:CRISPR-associated endonuclease Cas3'' [Alphaproteobacteria bacterium]
MRLPSLMPEYFAHSFDDPAREWERLVDHLHQVSAKAADFAGHLGAEEWGRAAGWLHDLGKASDAFQARLRGGPLCDHSTAGAAEAIRAHGGGAGRLLAYTVAGHHGGLPDSHELDARLDAPPPCDSVAMPDPPSPGGLPESYRNDPFAISAFTRMLFSCLVDADRLETERLYAPETWCTRAAWPTLAEMRSRLDRFLEHKQREALPSGINRRRAEILRRCRAAAAWSPGFFSLTVPTGGGKTLSSLAFALDHALKLEHGLRRIVYVIPYTSIIEQNAAEFRRAVGADAVLEHHSNVRVSGDEPDEDAKDRLRLAAETWDAPLVVTTNVQFFESLFASSPGRCRKLHNLARSVVVLDEAQMLPVPFLDPCLKALRHLVEQCGCTVVSCTATQPALGRSDWMPHGLDGVREIVEDVDGLYRAFSRVKVRHAGTLSEEELAGRLAAADQVLAVVDTREAARRLFERLRPLPGAVHLSARMCPRHRSRVLEKVKADLRHGRPCRLVSTQLIEAGVDIDFPEVWRALAGLDSLIQAAGRCNRENKLGCGTVWLFEPAQRRRVGEWQRRAEATRAVLDAFPDPLSPEAVREFFLRHYGANRRDAHGILPLLSSPRLDFQFREAAEIFRLIDDEMEPVIVPWEHEAEGLVRDLERVDAPGALLLRLQPWVVQLHAREMRALAAAGAVRMVRGRFAVLSDPAHYDPALGLIPDGVGMESQDFVV